MINSVRAKRSLPVCLDTNVQRAFLLFFEAAAFKHPPAPCQVWETADWIFSPRVPNQTAIRFRLGRCYLSENRHFHCAQRCVELDSLSTRPEHQMGRFKSMFGNGDRIYYWISILFPAIVCCFMVDFDFSQLANAEPCKNNKTIEARKRAGSLIKFWWLKLV